MMRSFKVTEGSEITLSGTSFWVLATFLAAAAGWCTTLTITTSGHTKDITELKAAATEIVKVLGDVKQDQALQNMKLDYLTGARRDRPPAAPISSASPAHQ